MLLRRRCLLPAVIVVLVAGGGWWLYSRTYAGPPVTPTPLPPSLHEDLVTTTLDNGLRLVLAPLSGHPTVTISVRVGVGLAHDPPRKSGLSHLYEHMVFRQRDDHSGFGNAELATFGGTSWAWTGDDDTTYYVTVPAEHLEAGVDWIADTVIRADLPAEHLPHERAVVLREVDERTHSQLIFHTTRAEIYGTHPYARTGLGNRSTVAAITHRDLLHWRRTHYVANNMTVVVAGGFDPAAARDYLYASCGGLQAAPLPVLEFADPLPPEARRVQAPFQGTADEFAMAWLGPRYTESSFHDLVLPALEQFLPVLFPGGGYGNPRLGTKASLNELGLQDVRDFYGTHFAADNLVLVAVGNFDPDLMGGYLKRELGMLDRRTPPGEATPEPDSHRRIDLSKSKTVRGVQHGALAWALMGFPAPGAVSDDYAAMLVLDALLGSGQSNRLATAIRDDQGLAYTVGSYFAITARDGYLAAYAGVVPDAVDTALTIMRATIADITAGAVSPTEVAAAKMEILRRHAGSEERADWTAYWLGRSEVAGAGYAWHDEMPDRLRAVSLDDVHRVAQRYLRKHVTSILTPPAGSD